MKCTKNYNARAEPLFYSWNLLFRDVPVAVAVVVFLNSLMSRELKLVQRLVNDLFRSRFKTDNDPGLQSETSVFKFLRRSVDGALFKFLLTWLIQFWFCNEIYLLINI